jgi:ribosome biogenesis GTPase A
MSSPPIQWYPGHVAKALGQLREQLRLVDVAIEVVDARIPLASRHPELDKWLGQKPRLLALNRADSIAARDLKAWQEYFSQQGIPVYPTNGQSGQGVSRLKQAILQLGQSVNERRQRRGMRPRAVRAVVVGFPNVGKSALLNRLLGRRAVESAARPGVTRQLQWVRLGGELDLLDSPGILPPSLPDQRAATLLAICDDIGAAAYDPRARSGLLCGSTAAGAAPGPSSFATALRLARSNPPWQRGSPGAGPTALPRRYRASGKANPQRLPQGVARASSFATSSHL